MQSDARTVDEYLAELPDDRRAAISAVRDVVLANLPAGFVESMNWGMISYEVPLETFPETYNGQPLSYAAIASQKQHMSVYLMGIYGSDTLRERFEADYRATGKRMDIGKSCVRFRKLDDLPLDLVGEAIGAVTLDQYLALYEEASSMRKSKATRAKKA
jgi:hypothetical protein